MSQKNKSHLLRRRSRTLAHLSDPRLDPGPALLRVPGPALPPPHRSVRRIAPYRELARWRAVG